MISTIGSNWKIFETAVISASDICLGNIVAAAENALGDAGKVDFDAICSDVDEYNFEISRPRVRHHSQVIFSRQSCLNREALTSRQISFCQTKYFTSRSDRLFRPG